MDELTEVLMLSGIVFAVINYLKSPILKVRPTWGEYLIYLQFVAAFAVVFGSGANVLASVSESEIIGRILTAMIAGGGSELIYSIQKRLITPMAEPAVIELAELVEVAPQSEAVVAPSPPVSNVATQYHGAYRPTGAGVS